VLEDRYPRATVGFGDVESLPDLVYATHAGHRPLRLDLYRLRASAQQAHPLVVYVHGGGWQSGHTRHSGAFGNWPGVLATLARRGYVVASIEYRLSGEAPFPAAIHDVKTAIRWLRNNAQAYGIDPRNAVIWGGSAGGQLAALAGMSCGAAALTPPGEPSASDCVQGVVAWYGVFDLASALSAAKRDAGGVLKSPVARYLGCERDGCSTEQLTLASPIAHIDRGDPPVLLIHGEKDATVPAVQSEQFYQALERAGVESRLRLLPAVDHSFIGSTPEATRAASLAALRETFAFIDVIAQRRP
jgi:acetyl esterase/lipase